MLETRTLFTSGKLTVEAVMHADEFDGPFDQDFESVEQREDFGRRFDDGLFQYVGIVVSVRFNGTRIGSSDLWGIEHGEVAEGVNADAWELTPAKYPDQNTVVMGSPLSGTVVEALSTAEDFLKSLCTEWETLGGVAGDLTAAIQWADPNAHADGEAGS